MGDLVHTNKETLLRDEYYLNMWEVLQIYHIV